MSATAAGVLVHLDRVSVRRGRRQVVHDVDLDVTRGEVVAVLGPNGAGKSTLLEALGGVLTPSSGVVDRTGRVATVLQTPGLARRSVRANVELALAWWGVPRRRRRAQALEALERMRAGHLATRQSGELSGGERRRVHVARGLAVRPDLLLLDEPFAGLDAETRAVLCEDTAAALRTGDSGVVVVVHDRAEAWALADRMLVMLDGRVVADDAPDRVLARPPTAAVARFLGYDGELSDGDRVLLTRPTHLRVTDDGDLPGVVARVLPQQDGVGLEVTTARGQVRVWTPEVGHVVGAAIRLSVVGGVRFATSPGPAPLQ